MLQYSQTLLPKKVWELDVEVIDMFENAKLKGQKNLSSLLTKLEFKQQCLAPLRHLEEMDLVSLLRKVVSGRSSLADLKLKLTQLRLSRRLH